MSKKSNYYVPGNLLKTDPGEELNEIQSLLYEKRKINTEIEVLNIKKRYKIKKVANIEKNIAENFWFWEVKDNEIQPSCVLSTAIKCSSSMEDLDGYDDYIQ